MNHRVIPPPDSVLLLVDGHNLAYRAYHAIAPMRTSSGMCTQALFGFIRTMEALPRTLSVSHVAVVFDGGLPPARRALLAAYKAQRPEMPKDLRAQFPLIEQYLDAAAIRWIRMPEQEADDVMATLARQAEPEAASVYLATTDRDLMQLASPVIRLVEPTKQARVSGEDEVHAKTGVRPDQVLAWRAMVGDSSDNIPGVPGIGPKTAARLLNGYGALEGIWDAIEAIHPPRIREALIRHRERIELNLRLMRLDDRVACPLNWKDCVKRAEDVPAMAALLRQVEFTSMLNDRRSPTLFG